MPKSVLYTMTEVAELFGVRTNTVSEVAGKLGIEPKPMTNHRAKGLDAADIRRLGRALGRPARTPEVAVAGR